MGAGGGWRAGTRGGSGQEMWDLRETFLNTIVGLLDFAMLVLLSKKLVIGRLNGFPSVS